MPLTEGELARTTDSILDVLAILGPLDLESYAPVVLEAARARGMDDGQAQFFVDVVGVLMTAQRALRGLAPHAALHRAMRDGA